MLKFRNMRSVPRGGLYVYEFKGTPVQAGSWYELLYALQRQGMRLTPEKEAEIQDYICHRLPEGFCMGETDKPLRPLVSMADIKVATRAVPRDTLVTPGKARMRADHCWKCPSHDRSLCTSCIGLVDWAHTLVDKRFLGSEYMGICAADLTALQVSLWADTTSEASEYPAACWRHNEDLK